MNSTELRDKFLDYFKKKGHKIVKSSSLLPTDPSVLLTTAGMQQFSLYLSGKKDPLEDFQGRHLVSCQKCFRTGDIEEIGDDTHHTFFEMLGNWSIGQDDNGYFKEGAIDFAMDFLVNELGLDSSKFYITVFKGEDGIEKDEEAVNIWMNHGIAREKIIECSKKDNFWGPVSDIGPCGPCSEIHYDRGEEYGCGRPDCGPNCDYCKRVVEIWNLVFMQYNRNERGEYELLNQTNIDTGIGFERLLSVLNGKNSAYETDVFADMIKRIEEVSGKKYEENEIAFRIIADHARSAIFLAGDGIEPSNLGQGYILRRIIRRAVRYSRMIGVERDMGLGQYVVKKYGEVYPELKENEDHIFEVISKEEEKFEKTIKAGLSVLEKLLEEGQEKISGEKAFDLYQSYGFPLELTEEIASEKGFEIDKSGFNEALKKHQELSRAGAEKKFGGVGKDAGEEGAKLHTATHLLHAALRRVLGENVQQMGSDINIERLRFDFSHHQKMTPEELKAVEDMVNEKIREDLEIMKEEMSLAEALGAGALAFFKEKYPEKVKVWTALDPKSGECFSKEICAGPHVNRTGELGKFKIIKEESSSAGVRRIKAVVNKE
ncbi:MAG: alanine--tRNA ligase [Minisyncoccus archaeiphilus]|uniref:alanine--tRNA ligase n=1 Tax=Minisyncoccus archaeiphilus TaxID=3238481 RepID=UPI002B169CD0|nr:MAG: alanine--tRNA ligase [Candidatus Parcubacteria bacterium]